MHTARLSSSARLQRALRALEACGGWMSTRAIMLEAHVCAVNSVIAELRANGAVIESRQRVTEPGKRIFEYRLKQAPEDWNG